MQRVVVLILVVGLVIGLAPRRTASDVPVAPPSDAAAAVLQTGTALPLRVHLFESDDPDIDASSFPREPLAERLAALDRLFAPAGIAWALERIVVERTRREGPFRQARDQRGHHVPALRGLVDPRARLAPAGFDLYVVGDLTTLGVGGAFVCDPREGGAFVSARTTRGGRPPIRKWAHELGHALGLRHTPCTAMASDQLMTSGKCEHAEPGRVRLSAAEIARIETQAAKGTSVTCAAVD